ncbi:chemical-damaging agent resistance protein C [Pantoea alhagi]|uniref:Chemical-damaging agent resistance protein C n=1 Tax=Pantoea alhagi TaxID=1891675 RepID=A0A1W6B9B1_9GAMM|nr:TerD family protein [Pantoea alhagi]ARJ43688.1 chemical-damaging agent resistance protein C [Pantoea alhagi]
MAVNLTKGGNVNLSKEAPTMTKAIVGLGWDARVTDGQSFDLDASVFLVGAEGKVLSDQHFVFFNNSTSPDGSVVHQGDNRTGEGTGDDEQVKIALSTVPADVQKAVFAVTIYDAETRKQNFGMVSNAYIRIVNEDNNTEIARYDLSEDASTETAMIFGELYRHNGEWKFKAVGQGFAGGLAALAAQHGVSV